MLAGYLMVINLSSPEAFLEEAMAILTMSMCMTLMDGSETFHR